MSLSKIQNELKAPKGQFNNFGKYKYRSCEDIVEAVKPILDKYEAYLTLSDDITLVGERVYVKATATITFKDGSFVFTTAFAREPLVKKGMDESQITGTASSYARKYALNGLLAIDDTKDADTMDNRKDDSSISTGEKKDSKAAAKRVLGDAANVFHRACDDGDEAYVSQLWYECELNEKRALYSLYHKDEIAGSFIEKLYHEDKSLEIKGAA